MTACDHAAAVAAVSQGASKAECGCGVVVEEAFEATQPIAASLSHPQLVAYAFLWARLALERAQASAGRYRTTALTCAVRDLGGALRCALYDDAHREEIDDR